MNSTFWRFELNNKTKLHNFSRSLLDYSHSCPSALNSFGILADRCIRGTEKSTGMKWNNWIAIKSTGIHYVRMQTHGLIKVKLYHLSYVHCPPENRPRVPCTGRPAKKARGHAGSCIDESPPIRNLTPPICSTEDHNKPIPLSHKLARNDSRVSNGSAKSLFSNERNDIQPIEVRTSLA